MIPSMVRATNNMMVKTGLRIENDGSPILNRQKNSDVPEKERLLLIGICSLLAFLNGYIFYLFGAHQLIRQTRDKNIERRDNNEGKECCG